MKQSLPFVDTNIFIRYLTKDNPIQSQKAYEFMKTLESGPQKAETSEAVIVEIVHVLSSKILYNLPRTEIRDKVLVILGLSGLRVPKKNMIAMAIQRYASTKHDFVDCLIVQHVLREQLPAVISFDEDFDKVDGVTRQEP